MNNGKITFNPDNVKSYKTLLVENRGVMNDLFNKYKGELINLEDSWTGYAASSSTKSMTDLIENYNKFLAVVDEFINNLEFAEQKFVSGEQTSGSQY